MRIARHASIVFAIVVMTIAGTSVAGAADGPLVRLHAAGSLRSAMTEIAQAFTERYGIRVVTNFSSSGLLRERFEKGEAGDVFASADMANPQKLQQEGLAGPVVLFARNRLCAIARPGLEVAGETLLAAMLDPALKLGTSTPGADPSGDYAWEVFRKAEAIRPGSRAALEAKALKLMGGPDSPQPPAALAPFVWHLKEGRADLFLAYCTGAREALAQLPGASSIDLPPALATGADYGLTVLNSGEAAPAGLLGLFILSADGQAILRHYGFVAPLL